MSDYYVSATLEDFGFIPLFFLAIFVLKLISNMLFVAGHCYHCKKTVWIWNDYYGQKTDVDNMYLSKDKKYGKPYHKKCCHENEPFFHTQKWIDDDFKII